MVIVFVSESGFKFEHCVFFFDRDISSMRFDPSIEDHHHLEIKPDAGKVKEAKKRFVD